MRKVKLSLVYIWAIVVGTVVGDGIFLLMGEGGTIAGPLSIASYFMAEVLLSCIVISFEDIIIG